MCVLNVNRRWQTTTETGAAMAKQQMATSMVAGGPGPGLASMREAERYLSVSRAKLYSMMDAGELRYVKLGRSRRVPWDALTELVQKNLVGA
jgi:excisionase family DNA binding protein